MAKRVDVLFLFLLMREVSAGANRIIMRSSDKLFESDGQDGIEDVRAGFVLCSEFGNVFLCIGRNVLRVLKISVLS